MNDDVFWVIVVVCMTIGSMWSRYQWRKAWEAYYKRPYARHKTPHDTYEDEAWYE